MLAWLPLYRILFTSSQPANLGSGVSIGIQCRFGLVTDVTPHRLLVQVLGEIQHMLDGLILSSLSR